MKITFSTTRPAGDHALVLAVAGKDQAALTALGDQVAGIRAALARQRFEGEAGSAAELFIDDGGTTRRLLVVGTGAGVSAGDEAKRPTRVCFVNVGASASAKGAAPRRKSLKRYAATVAA